MKYIYLIQSVADSAQFDYYGMFDGTVPVERLFAHIVSNVKRQVKLNFTTEKTKQEDPCIEDTEVTYTEITFVYVNFTVVE